jgi:hypothetical protein
MHALHDSFLFHGGFYSMLDTLTHCCPILGGRGNAIMTHARVNVIILLIRPSRLALTRMGNGPSAIAVEVPRWVSA